MAVLDNFEVVVLTSGQSERVSSGGPIPQWKVVKEYRPPGAENQKPRFNVCRKYIGVPHIQAPGASHPTGLEFAIDYKIKCGFKFADQEETDVEYIVFRTYLDAERIGSAYVKRRRWERSGSYRIRKQGKRYMLENDHRWIRNRWMFDPGLHGTIKVEVWRERSETPIMTDWGVIDLTRGEDPVVRPEELKTMTYDANVGQPRVRRLNKLDLLPMATFEFEYRGDDTLQQLGLNEQEDVVSNSQQIADQLFSEGKDELWNTLTNTSSSDGTTDNMMDTPSLDMGQPRNDKKSFYNSKLANPSVSGIVSCTDPVEQTLLSSVTLSEIPAVQVSPWGEPRISLTQVEGRCDLGFDSTNVWWTGARVPVRNEELQKLQKVDVVDLTMLE